MKIITWNMNFWWEYRKNDSIFNEWRKKCITALDNFNADFILLQEINPVLLFDIKIILMSHRYNIMN